VLKPRIRSIPLSFVLSAKASNISFAISPMYTGTSGRTQLYVIEDAYILQVQRLLYDFVAVDAFCAVGAVGVDVATVIGLAFNVPLAGVLGIVDMDVGSYVFSSLQIDLATPSWQNEWLCIFLFTTMKIVDLIPYAISISRRGLFVSKTPKSC